MISYRYPIIAREGWRLIIVVFLLAVVVFQLAGWLVSLPGWMLLFFTLYAYRDPARTIPSTPLAIVAPVDGQVVKIDEVQDHFVDRMARRIVIEMHLFDIHSAHSPTEGKVIRQWYGNGQNEEGGQDRRVSFAQWIQTDEGDDVVVAAWQHAHLQKPRCYVSSGERIGQGQRCGYIPSAATVEVLIPASSRVDVREGGIIRAGSDVIATLIH